MESEKPDGLSDVELEEFTLMVEEQAFPFEEKAIQVHEKNMELLANGIYSTWIDRSIDRLAKLLPARYAKPEESTNHIAKIDNYIYSSPRFKREDASTGFILTVRGQNLSTGFIVNLDFFRYSSQKSQLNHHKYRPKGDTDNRRTVNQGTQGVAVSANSSVEKPGSAKEESSVEEVQAGVSSPETAAAQPEVKASTESGSNTEKVTETPENDAPKQQVETTKEDTKTKARSESAVDDNAKTEKQEQEQKLKSDTEVESNSVAESESSKGKVNEQTTNNLPENNVSNEKDQAQAIDANLDSVSSQAQSQE